MASAAVTGVPERTDPPADETLILFDQDPLARFPPDQAPLDQTSPDRAQLAQAPRDRRLRHLPGRVLEAIGRSAVSDFTVFFSRPIAVVREKKLLAIPGTLVCVALIAFFGVVQHTDRGLTFMMAVAGLHQDEPLWVVLAKIPLSMFAPAPGLPVWGALLQVFIAFGLAECWLGWKRTVAVAIVTSGLTSVAARIMVSVSFHLHVGTPQFDSYQLDTGPSVAVVALLVYLALRVRTYWIVAVTAISMGSEAALLPNLAGREHLVAISLGFGAYLVVDRLTPWVQGKRRGSRRRSAGPGAEL